ncbi:MAG: PAS domain-containing protein, partial [Ancalomicrobiaceae bacterium]|nr:PAS domain-containing protein [Ancalomicrobiaceae bacterium]
TATATDEGPVDEAHSIIKAAGARTWVVELPDGRAIQIVHQTMPDGGWVATHEDITELKATRSVANERLSLQALIDCLPDYLWVKDTDSRFVVVNKALALDSGRARTSDMIGLTDFDLHPYDVAIEFRANELGILRSGQTIVDREEMVFDAAGNRRWLSSTKVPLCDEQGTSIGLIACARDVTARKLASLLRDGQAKILEDMAIIAPLNAILEQIALLVEFQLSGVFCVIMLLSDDGAFLRRGAAPSLADMFAAASDGIRVGPKAASCGTAIFRKETVIVTDVAVDPLWEDYQHLVVGYDLKSCWSTPIMSGIGEPLGTFAMYSGMARSPNADENALAKLAVHLAGIAIDLQIHDGRLRAMANDAYQTKEAAADHESGLR